MIEMFNAKIIHPKILIFQLFLILFLLPGYSANAQSTVSIEEKTLVIPTYEVGPPDKKPYFFSGRTYQGAQGHIYPYPLYDELTDVRYDKNYKSIYLNNEYVELCVVPELGGRIFSALDKTNNYDFFYRQHVVKPSLIGMIGSWMSGGVEWNIPDHHRVSTMLPTDYKMVENGDGSKTIWVGETEYSRRIRWMVGLTVYPNRSYIEATVKVFNTSPFIHPFLYWANVAVFCDENYQVIFPPSTQYGVQHAKNEFTNWNIGTGEYGGADRTGVDLSWWKNHTTPISIFAWHSEEDFLTGYDHKKEAGTVHVANHHIVGGKKFFLWGNNPEAEMWEKMLTEKDGQYIELMAGAYSDNQPDYSWISPGESRTFKQIWYPIKKIGGVKNANRNASVNMERASASKIKFGFNTTTKYTNALVTILARGNSIFSEVIDISPESPYISELTIDSNLKNEDLKIILSDQSKLELISYQPIIYKEQEMPQPVEKPRDPESYASNQELYLTGLRIEQFKNATIDPMLYYEEALKRDSLDYLVNNVLGIRAIKEGRYADAENYLRRSLKRVTKNYTSPKDVEAYYYKGVLCHLTNRLKDAKDAFWKATWNTGFQSAAYFSLAQIACVENDLQEAFTLINRSLTYNTLDARAQTLKAYVLRKQGKKEEAFKLANEIEGVDNLYLWNLAERNSSDGLIWQDAEKEEFKNLLGGKVQSILEVAESYGNIGAYEEAIELLTLYTSLYEGEQTSPMLYYLKGFYQFKDGDNQAALQSWQLAAKVSSDYCFPYRLREIEVLETAIEQNPGDSKAYYYLGNLYYYLNQKEKAIEKWEQSAELDNEFYLVFRNLGFAYNHAQGDLGKAIAVYEKSIELNPNDAGLFYETDVLYEQIGKSPELRLSLLERNIETIKKRDDATSRLVILYNEMGYYNKALNILQNRHFHVWEGGGNIHNVFVNSCLLKGISEFNKKQFEKALSYFKIASTYPDNLEVGENSNGGRIAEVSYFIAKTLDKMGKQEEALEYYQTSANWNKYKRTTSLLFNKALSLQKIGNNADAEKLFDELKAYANVQMDSNQGIDFFSKFGNQTNKTARMAEFHYMLGLSHLGQGDIVEANKEFEKTLKLNQNHIWAKIYFSGKIKL